MYLVCHVTSHYHVIKRSCEFMGGSSSCYVIMVISYDTIGAHKPPSLKFRSPLNLVPLNTKAPGPPLIYLVGPLAISDPHINICVGPLTLALLSSNLIYYPQHIVLKQFH